VTVRDLPRSELFRCVNDTNNRLVPRLRTIATPVAIFIDSVDEYFNKHIKMRSSRASDTGVVSPSIWYYSQLGLVQVAYELRRVRPPLKGFPPGRPGAFAPFPPRAFVGAQAPGRTAALPYTRRRR